jgi:flagellin-like protein
MRSIIKQKKGVSPVIASLLLVIIVIILAMIIFIWAKSFIKEVVQKKGVSASQVCGEIKLDVTFNPSSGEVIVSNLGNYPIYALELGFRGNGETIVVTYNFGGSSLRLGGGEIITEDKLVMGMGEMSNYAGLEVTPVILGETSKGKNTQYTCKDNPITAEVITE